MNYFFLNSMTMNDYDERKRHARATVHVWLAIGVVALILLLLLWVDVADIVGAGDGAAMIRLPI